MRSVGLSDDVTSLVLPRDIHVRELIASTSLQSQPPRLPSCGYLEPIPSWLAQDVRSCTHPAVFRPSRFEIYLPFKAVADAAGAGGDAAKISSATAALAKARDAAKQLAEKAKLSAAEAERLLNKIKSDTRAP
jgi:hypothetical protein